MAFYPLAQLSQLFDGYQRAFSIDEHRLLLIQHDGEVFIIENRCPHMDVPLDSGIIETDKSIRCRAHGIAFDLSSGKAKGPLADTLDCLKHFTVEYQDTAVGIVV